MDEKAQDNVPAGVDQDAQLDKSAATPAESTTRDAARSDALTGDAATNDALTGDAATGKEAAEQENATAKEDAFDRMGASRFKERPLMFTRADILAAAGSLVLAGAVAARQWFGVGRSSDDDSTDVAVAMKARSDAQEGQLEAPGAEKSAPDIEPNAPEVVTDAPAGDAVSSSAPSDVPAGAGMYAVVQDAEGFYQVLPLWEDAELRVESSQGYNVVQVSEGKIRVSEADCKNQVCVHAGWVQYEGQLITCLPHKTVVEVVSNPDEASRLS